MFRGSIIETGPAETVLMNPLHPYTKLLRESIPEADPKKRWESVVKLSDAEKDDSLRKGCKFAGRCPQVQDRCKIDVPTDNIVGGSFCKVPPICSVISEY